MKPNQIVWTTFGSNSIKQYSLLRLRGLPFEKVHYDHNNPTAKSWFIVLDNHTLVLGRSPDHHALFAMMAIDLSGMDDEQSRMYVSNNEHWNPKYYYRVTGGGAVDRDGNVICWTVPAYSLTTPEDMRDGILQKIKIALYYLVDQELLAQSLGLND